MITLPYTTLYMYIRWHTAVAFKRDSLFEVSQPCQIIKNQWNPPSFHPSGWRLGK